MKGALQTVWSVARWVLLGVGLVAVVGGLLVLAIWVVPGMLVGVPRKGLTEADRLKALNDARSPLVTVVGGLLLFTGALIGAYLTSRTIQVNRESNEISRKGQEAGLEITRQGQITERFTRAIDQLGQHGPEKLDVRLGGIYALERIAHESTKDHGPIMEVLTAYLREHARVQPVRVMPWQPIRAVGPTQPGEQAHTTDANEPPRPRADVQAVATVLGRRPEERRQQELRGLDLREVDLRRAGLSDAHLEIANLRGAHLQKANLIGARLEGANCIGTHLEAAALTFAHLEKAKLRDAHLEGADLRAAHLERADLRAARLERANLSGAHLEGANLIGAHLKEVDLRDAHLRDAQLGGANLFGANLGTALGVLRDQLQSAFTDDATILPMFADERPPG